MIYISNTVLNTFTKWVLLFTKTCSDISYSVTYMQSAAGYISDLGRGLTFRTELTIFEYCFGRAVLLPGQSPQTLFILVFGSCLVGCNIN